MPSLKVIKRRITSVRSTQQITRAMDLVAASSLQKAKARLDSARPLINETNRVLETLKVRKNAGENIFIKPREVKSSAFIVITSDRGLCGGYNVNVANEALAHINRVGSEQIIAMGSKGNDFFRRRRKNVIREYKNLYETVFYGDAEEVGRYITYLYATGKVDEVYIAYTKFASVLSHEPCVKRILPVGGAEEAETDNEMEFEPDADTVLKYFVPQYVNVSLYGAMLESVTCEQAARMVSMEGATNNADEIIDDLTLSYNHIRQSAITQEINEIVSGANALK